MDLMGWESDVGDQMSFCSNRSNGLWVEWILAEWGNVKHGSVNFSVVQKYIKNLN